MIPNASPIGILRVELVERQNNRTRLKELLEKLHLEYVKAEAEIEKIDGEVAGLVRAIEILGDRTCTPVNQSESPTERYQIELTK